MPNFLINTDIKLQNIIKDLKSSSVIGLDTEFIRESTYYPILALLQLSDENHTYCLDILALEDKEPIINLLKDKNIIKIIHSSKQDLEVLNNYYDCYPENIFDTQLADNFLNPQISISYSNLVKKHFNVFLKEGSWRTDWLKRPISNDKLEYAGNDVKYLIKLHEILKSELTKLERYDWFLEEQDLELKKSNVVTEPAMAWEKVNLPSKITETQINHLKILSKWREEKAIQNDMPKRWIFSDSELIKITLARSNKIMSILDNLKHQPNEEDISYILSVLELKYDEAPVEFKNFDASMYNKRVNICHQTLEVVCDEYKVASSLIANKRDIDLFARGRKDIRFLQGWRFKIFGKLVQ
jgi:ribonuclease D